MAGFLRADPVKLFDIESHYGDGEEQDMLVRNARFGTALATMFGNREKPDETVVLMRKHGFTTLADNIVTAVYRAIYTRINAEVQTKAMALSRAVAVQGEHIEQGGFSGLRDSCLRVCETYQDKPWALWVREVRKNQLYENTLG